ncbi:MAG: 3-methyl-2-oxobutanoate hydroxymethyltransferase, partial [Omnitrophica WOR_2 bacterium RIFOXYC2_FULL_43_9]
IYAHRGISAYEGLRRATPKSIEAKIIHDADTLLAVENFERIAEYGRGKREFYNQQLDITKRLAHLKGCIKEGFNEVDSISYLTHHLIHSTSPDTYYTHTVKAMVSKGELFLKAKNELKRLIESESIPIDDKKSIWDMIKQLTFMYHSENMQKVEAEEWLDDETVWVSYYAISNVLCKGGMIVSSAIAFQLIEKAVACGKMIMLTAYDAKTARALEEAGIHWILVGDSVAMVVHGFDTTRFATMEMMERHVRQVREGVRNKDTIVIGDMTWLSYETEEEAVENARRLIRAGATVVKVEGGREKAHIVRAIVNAGIAVMGHLGYTPQTGKLRVYGKNEKEQQRLFNDALSLQAAGAFAIVLEMVYSEVAKALTEMLEVPTVGIGAGKDTRGQVLVINDILGISKFISGKKPRFVKKFIEKGENHSNPEVITAVARRYKEAVISGEYPALDNYFSLAVRKNLSSPVEKTSCSPVFSSDEMEYCYNISVGLDEQVKKEEDMLKAKSLRQEAIKAYKIILKALKSQPTSQLYIQALINTAVDYFYLGKYTIAIRMAEKALTHAKKVSKGDRAILLILAGFYQDRLAEKQGTRADIEKIKGYVKDALKFAPSPQEKVQCYYILGNSAYYDGDFPLAKKYIKEALAIDRSYIFALFLHCRLLLEEGNKEEARKILDGLKGLIARYQGISSDRKKLENNFYLLEGKFSVLNRDSQEALKVLSEGIEAIGSPKDSDDTSVLAEMRYERGLVRASFQDVRQAREDFEKAIELYLGKEASQAMLSGGALPDSVKWYIENRMFAPDSSLLMSAFMRLSNSEYLDNKCREARGLLESAWFLSVNDGQRFEILWQSITMAQQSGNKAELNQFISNVESLKLTDEQKKQVERLKISLEGLPDLLKKIIELIDALKKAAGSIKKPLKVSFVEAVNVIEQNVGNYSKEELPRIKDAFKELAQGEPHNEALRNKMKKYVDKDMVVRIDSLMSRILEKVGMEEKQPDAKQEASVRLGKQAKEEGKPPQIVQPEAVAATQKMPEMSLPVESKASIETVKPQETDVRAHKENLLKELVRKGVLREENTPEAEAARDLINLYAKKGMLNEIVEGYWSLLAIVEQPNQVCNFMLKGKLYRFKNVRMMIEGNLPRMGVSCYSNGKYEKRRMPLDELYKKARHTFKFGNLFLGKPMDKNRHGELHSHYWMREGGGDEIFIIKQNPFLLIPYYAEKQSRKSFSKYALAKIISGISFSQAQNVIKQINEALYGYKQTHRRQDKCVILFNPKEKDIVIVNSNGLVVGRIFIEESGASYPDERFPKDMKVEEGLVDVTDIIYESRREESAKPQADDGQPRHEEAPTAVTKREVPAQEGLPSEGKTSGLKRRHKKQKSEGTQEEVENNNIERKKKEEIREESMLLEYKEEQEVKDEYSVFMRHLGLQAGDMIQDILVHIRNELAAGNRVFYGSDESSHPWMYAIAEGALYQHDPTVEDFPEVAVEFYFQQEKWLQEYTRYLVEIIVNKENELSLVFPQSSSPIDALKLRTEAQRVSDQGSSYLAKLLRGEGTRDDITKAISSFQQALKIAERNKFEDIAVICNNSLGLLLLQEGQAEKALKHLLRIDRQKLKEMFLEGAGEEAALDVEFNLISMLGLAYFGLKNTSEAGKYARELRDKVDGMPDKFIGILNLFEGKLARAKGDFTLAMGFIDESIGWLEKVEDENVLPTIADSLYEMGICLLQSKDAMNAEEFFWDSIRASLNSDREKNLLLEEIGNLARKTLIFKGDRLFLRNILDSLVEVLKEKGEFDSVEALYKAQVKLSEWEEMAESLLKLAQFYKEKNAWDELIALYEKELSGAVKCKELITMKVEALLRRGKAEDIVTAFLNDLNTKPTVSLQKRTEFVFLLDVLLQEDSTRYPLTQLEEWLALIGQSEELKHKKYKEENELIERIKARIAKLRSFQESLSALRLILKSDITNISRELKNGILSVFMPREEPLGRLKRIREELENLSTFFEENMNLEEKAMVKDRLWTIDMTLNENSRKVKEIEGVLASLYLSGARGLAIRRVWRRQGVNLIIRNKAGSSEPIADTVALFEGVFSNIKAQRSLSIKKLGLGEEELLDTIECVGRRGVEVPSQGENNALKKYYLYPVTLQTGEQNIIIVGIDGAGHVEYFDMRYAAEFLKTILSLLSGVSLNEVADIAKNMLVGIRSKESALWQIACYGTEGAKYFLLIDVRAHQAYRYTIAGRWVKLEDDFSLEKFLEAQEGQLITSVFRLSIEKQREGGSKAVIVSFPSGPSSPRYSSSPIDEQAQRLKEGVRTVDDSEKKKEFRLKEVACYGRILAHPKASTVEFPKELLPAVRGAY